MAAKTNATKGNTEIKNVPAVKVAEIHKSEPAKQENEIKALLMPTAAQRLKNAQNFQLVGKRYDFLKAKQDELNTFNVSSDDTQEKLTLTNSSGFKFEISNSNVISSVLGLLSSHIESKLEETEKEILAFTI